MEKKHTTGPWHWNGGCNVTVGSGAYMIAATSRWQWEEEQNRPTSEQIANARLIAAAPELLEALIGVVKVADRATKEFDKARAAISKAIGA